ncbi:hypothetical protein PHBOTO_002119 [Pseudozyma hubeiensis]|nr:hypothetical protein PHBOTO_002119 [Pseudozyma hubeiensis]
MSATTKNIGVPAVPSAQNGSNAPSAASNTDHIDASDVSSTITTDRPSVTDVDVADSGVLKSHASELAVTGLTPDQVMQELKENGYVDQLRRRMYDAFLASEKPSTGPTAVADPAHTTGGVPGSSISTAAPSTTSTSTTIDSQPTPTLTPSTADSQTTATTTSQANTTSSSLDIGTKPTFLARLSTLLSDHITSDHSNLRLLHPRDQQISLLNSLETNHVHHPNRNTFGDATIYELLVKHVVSTKDGMREEGTGGMLDRDQGWVGKEANRKVKEVIREMMARASAKDGDEEEGDEDEDEDEDEGDEDGEERQGADTATQPPHSSPLHSAQPSSIPIADMQQD